VFPKKGSKFSLGDVKNSPWGRPKILGGTLLAFPRECQEFPREGFQLSLTKAKSSLGMLSALLGECQKFPKKGFQLYPRKVKSYVRKL
jgi:hypothetical protein